MPEASVDQNCDPLSGEHDVGRPSKSGNWAIVHPIPQPHPVELTADRHLRSSVAPTGIRHTRAHGGVGSWWQAHQPMVHYEPTWVSISPGELGRIKRRTAVRRCCRYARATSGSVSRPGCTTRSSSTARTRCTGSGTRKSSPPTRHCGECGPATTRRPASTEPGNPGAPPCNPKTGQMQGRVGSQVMGVSSSHPDSDLAVCVWLFWLPGGRPDVMEIPGIRRD